MFRPDLTFGFVFDDNLFMRTTPEGDVLLRLTPGFDVVRDTTNLRVNGSFRFDAERYQERADLDEAVARQSSMLDLRWQANSRFTVLTRAAYQRSQTPIDLNVATGLVGGRQPASLLDLSFGIENRARPSRRVLAGVDYQYNAVERGVDSSMRAARVRYTEELGPRAELYFNYRFEQREFLPGAVFVSHVPVGGWVYRITPSLRFVLEGGSRFVDGDMTPEFNVMAEQVINGLTTFSASYAHTQDVAVGVAELITIDRGTAAITVRRDQFWEVIVGSGVFRNVQVMGDTLAYDLSGTFGRALTKTLWLMVSANRTFNRFHATDASASDTEILRNWIMVGVRVEPFRPR